MSYTNNYLITTILIIVITRVYLLNISIAFSIKPDTELRHICLPNNKPFTYSYSGSLALVLIDVIINTASNQGFRKASYNRFNNNEEWAYGLAQCRGDVSVDDCKTCVNNAALTLINTTHCPDNQSAIIWRDYCLLKYSDVDFFGEVDTANNFSMFDGSEIFSSNYAISKLMNSLKETAIESTTFYANETRSGTITDDTTLYGMVQCTIDLVKDDCKTCLETAIKGLPKDPKNFNLFYIGGRVVYGSCNVRYETYNFLTHLN